MSAACVRNGSLIFLAVLMLSCNFLGSVAQPAPTSIRVTQDVKDVLQSFGFDHQQGHMALYETDPIVLEETAENSVSWSIFPKQTLENYVMHYEVMIESSVPVSGCGAIFHTVNQANYLPESYRIIAFLSPDGHYWAVEKVLSNTPSMEFEPIQTTAFQYQKDSTTPFTLIVKGSKAHFYSGSTLIGEYQSQRTSGVVGLLAYKILGDGKVTCKFTNFWVWAGKK